MKLENVGYLYGSYSALTGINLNINKGDFICLVGDNGSGKSTLLKILSGLLTPSEGKYIFEDEIIDKKVLKKGSKSKVFHHKVGYLFQNSDVQLFNPTVRDEIAFGLLQLGISNGEIDLRVKDCLSLLQIEKLSNRNAINLSGGEKKLAALAAVLALNPEYILFDEPFGGLTKKNRKIVSNILQQLHEAGKTIIVSTHNYVLLNDMATRLIALGSNHTIIYDGGLLPERSVEQMI